MKENSNKNLPVICLFSISNAFKLDESVTTWLIQAPIPTQRNGANATNALKEISKVRFSPSVRDISDKENSRWSPCRASRWRAATRRWRCHTANEQNSELLLLCCFFFVFNLLFDSGASCLFHDDNTTAAYTSSGC